MAQVTQVRLHPLRVLPATGEVAVQIDYEIVFTRAESGRRYEVVIDLVGADDLPERTPVASLSFGFRGAIPLVPTLTKLLTVEPGRLIHTGSVAATLNRALLGEAQGVKVIPSPVPELPQLTFVLPHRDEIRARVSVRHHMLSSRRPVPSLNDVRPLPRPPPRRPRAS